MDLRIQALLDRGLISQQVVAGCQPLPGESLIEALLREELQPEIISPRLLKLLLQLIEQLTAPAHNDDLLSALIDAPEIEISPVIALVERLLQMVTQQKFGELCLELDQTAPLVRIRARINQVWSLLKEPQIPKQMMPGVTARLKILANLDISERRLPQSGIITLTGQDQERNVMVHCLPTSNREEILLRYRTESAKPDYEQLSLPIVIHNYLQEVMRHRHGIILAIGPSDSGRSTTLHALARHFLLPEHKTIAVEHTSQYHLPGVTQMTANMAIGLNFAYAIKAALRHLPDVVIAGELMDRESAEILTNAGSSNTLVLARMTMDTPVHAICRFMDWGIDPFLLASSLRIVLNQRLVRLLCPSCKSPTHEIANPFAANGCPDCLFTGFQGLRAVFEATFIDKKTQEMLRNYDNRGRQLRKYIYKHMLGGLRGAALTLAQEGLTTLEEAIRNTPA